VVWWLLKDKEELKEEQRAFIVELLEKSPIIKAAYELVLEFRRMIKNRDGKMLKDWFGKVEQSGIRGLFSRRYCWRSQRVDRNQRKD
jgi:hypothetical protein